MDFIIKNAQIIVMIIFISIFIITFISLFIPGAKKKYDDYANIPLEGDDNERT
jgi:cbb3-type cytochrome oxidase subunit 3